MLVSDWSIILPSGLPDTPDGLQVHVYHKDKTESVQRRFTKRLKGFGRISYVAHQGWSCQKSDLTMWCFVLFGVLLIWIAIAFSVSLIVSPFTRVVIILDCISSTEMLTAV